VRNYGGTNSMLKSWYAGFESSAHSQNKKEIANVRKRFEA